MSIIYGIDSKIFSAYPTSNYGTDSDIYAYYYPDITPFLVRSIVSFDLSGFSVINSITLHLYRYNSGLDILNIHKMTSSFNENEVTWNKSSSLINWTTLGGDYDSQPLYSRSSDVVGWMTFDIPISVVNSQTKKLNLILKTNESGTSSQLIRMVSSNSTSSDPIIDGNLYKPYIEINATPVTTGKLNVSSSPSGANIYINGIDSLSVTPIEFSNVEEGTYIVELRLTGYNNFIDNNVIVTSGMTTYKSYNLVTTNGNLSITSSPSGAKVFIDGVDINKYTPVLIQNVSPGQYSIELRLSGYNNIVDNNVSVSSGITTYRDYTLTSVIETGTLSISSNPYGASIYIDGSLTTYITPSTISDVSVGLHTIKLSLQGYNDYYENVEILLGQTKTISTDLIRIESNTLTYAFVGVMMGIAVYSLSSKKVRK